MFFIDYRITRDDDDSPDFQWDFCEHCDEYTLHMGTIGGECSQCFDDRHCEDEFD